MPTTLRVWAHWTDAPAAGSLAVAPVPPSLSGYPGTVPTIDFPGSGGIFPPWPPTPGAPWAVWCELSKLPDISSARWAGATWPGPPPPSPDQGFAAQALGFKVTQVALIFPVPPAP